jgi:hypothetical protein
LNLKFKPHTTYNTNQLVQDFIQFPQFKASYCSKHCSCYSNTRGVTTLPSNRNLTPRFGRRGGSNRNSEQSHISSLQLHKVWMARTEKVIAFLSCFFLSVVAPLYLEELDCFMPCDMILLIQDFDWVLGVRQVSLEQCHLRQHDVHGWL